MDKLETNGWGQHRYPLLAIRLRVFGVPRVALTLDASEQPLPATRPMQLLAYLAVRGSWQYRDDIAQLFWPDRTDKIAHSNLRNLLVKTTAAAPFAPLEANEHALRLNVTTDLAEFMSAVQQGNAERAVQLGAQELLQGFDGESTEPWQHWLQRERENAQGHWISAVQRLLGESTRPIEQRAALAEQWALRCPYDEDAVRARMALAYEQGRAGVAASLYRSFSTLLQASFGVSASRELERFAHGGSSAASGAGPASSAAPAPSSPRESARPLRVRRSSLVGRRLELKQLKALLADPGKRLITLTGPGGVGKSALISELYAQWTERETDDRAAQAVLVDVSAAPDAQGLIGAIAEALSLPGLQGPGNEAGLAATLRDRSYLLMIDGAEQAGLAAPLTVLIERCPNTRLLIASRRIVQIDGEQRFPLEGFPLPDTDEDDAEVLASNDGVHYFAEAMASAGQAADLHHDAALIAELTRAVEGLPLALKLLAPLTRLFSLPQLLENVRRFTGNFNVTGPQTVFGPFKDVVTYPMQNAVGMTPKHGDAISDPAMCGSCHVVETEILNKNVTYNRSSFGKQPKSHEQTTYLEWLNSRYQTKAPPGPGATPLTCQQCHMPRTMNGQPITTKIANIEDNTYVDLSGQPFPNTAPAADITMQPRSEFGRHTFVGANVFVLEMFKQFGDQLGLTPGDRNYDTTNFAYKKRLDLSTEETVAQVQSQSASVAIRTQRKSANGLDVDVEVINKTGHKFPSGVGFRRAFIEFTAMDGNGNSIWSSGRSTDKGVLIDDSGTPLVTEFSKTTWQPHWRIITGSKYAQIYESRTKDLQGLLTTSFLGLAKPVKDNRLTPVGWNANGPYASWTTPVAVPTATNPGYYNGSGRDLVTYRMPAAIAPRVKSVRAVLNYQSIPPYYLQDRFTIGGNNPATAQLRALTQLVDYSNTAAKGWKVQVASVTRVIP